MKCKCSEKQATKNKMNTNVTHPIFIIIGTLGVIALGFFMMKDALNR